LRSHFGEDGVGYRHHSDGSGLNVLAQEAPAKSAISYPELGELPQIPVPGHTGLSCLTN
jgi:hypothetical protein